jgi:hypothetical protein
MSNFNLADHVRIKGKKLNIYLKHAYRNWLFEHLEEYELPEDRFFQSSLETMRSEIVDRGGDIAEIDSFVKGLILEDVHKETSLQDDLDKPLHK